ncbi:hypothetical protein ACFQGE_01830 [Halomicroarcula sp. GCM10025817]|uniref:hypothetical protein n=1 Tax=Haloarcula TaxID=2237 RepID=UPI0023E8AAB1|nr:hypothetical protein [Halomicroarcula sp. SYNS111]
MSGTATDDETTETSTETRTPADEPTETDTPTTPDDPLTETPGEVTPDPDDPIAVVLSNGTDETLDVAVTVRRGGTRIFETTSTVGPDERPELDTGIAETGDYELTVSVTGGPEVSQPFDIESYDVRMGSNLIAEIDTERIMILIEE